MAAEVIQPFSPETNFLIKALLNYDVHLKGSWSLSASTQLLEYEKGDTSSTKKTPVENTGVFINR